MRTIKRTNDMEGEEWGAEYSVPLTDKGAPENSSDFRYALWRIWDQFKEPAMVIGLNPSTADHLRNDPTVALCIADARAWGCGGLVMMNIWPYRSTDPDQMKRYYQKWCSAQTFNDTSKHNTAGILKWMERCRYVVAAWSGHAAWLGQGEKMYHEISRQREDILCYGACANGEARHPLYLKRPAKLVPYRRQTT